MTKVCTKCGTEKDIKFFYPQKSGKFRVKSWCKTCCSGYTKERRSDPEIKHRHAEDNSKFYKDNLPSVMLTKARQRAREEGFPCTISKEDVIIPEFCPILEIKLEKGNGKKHDFSPSLDRVNTERGYIPGNIAVMSLRANRIKSTGTAEEHRKIAYWMKHGHKEPVECLTEVDHRILRPLMGAAKTRAKRKNLEFNIERSDVLIPERCPILGVKLHYKRERGGDLFDSISLDRVDNTRGYVKGNIAIISHRANTIKHNGTIEEHLKIADWMDEMIGEKAA